MATICAYILLPLITYHYINKLSVSKYAWNDIFLRHALLTLAMIEVSGSVQVRKKIQ